ncbi:protein kinase domain-containing protein [Paraliomyxa miuraensis]|uniref:serine/threonine-protein kinase n=1 Tax=Paraliomyxa miuraensis TaxID=376150 RepID=UPI00224E5AF6|nr:serine/threonine-protein kinase [Paraliomyxa miuraensis]MCX4243347.1 serine/threonine-protein kinase [Paraliomyxa miuraensis]
MVASSDLFVTEDGHASGRDGAASAEVRSIRGQHVGRFLVLGPLGHGGMGIVVEAHDEQLDRNVALKLLHPEMARRHHARLLREAQALARLSHPNVVQIYDVGMVGQRMFIAMELVRGCTLTKWQRSPRPWREVVAHYLQAARGLAAAHAKGLIHRDFKPDNCILGDDGRVRVLDFGLAREVGTRGRAEATLDEPVEDHAAASSSLKARLTREGVVLGTLAYMSLEQLQGQPADARTDQYSLCAALHEALHGVLPYEADGPGSLMRAMLEGRRMPVAGAPVPRRIRQVLERGLSLRPAERWPSMDALIGALEAGTRRRRGWPAAAMLGIGLALGGGLSLRSSPPSPCAEIDATLLGAWDEDARQRVAEAFARHDPPDANVLEPRVTAILDDHARAWGTMAHESCTATFVTHEQSEATFERRARCLERSRNHAVVAIDVLVGAEDAAALVQGSVLPFKLPRLTACAEALGERHPPVEELASEPRHDELRRDIDRANDLREIGRYVEAQALASGAVKAATALGAPHLHAEALECLGRINAEGWMMPETRGRLEAVIDEASRLGQSRVEARAWLSLVYAAAMQGELEEARHYLLGAASAVERVGDPLLRAWLLNDRGVLASRQGDEDSAIAHLTEALELKVRALGAEHLDVGIAHNNLATALIHARRHRAAGESIERARSIFEATVGPSSIFMTHALIGSCSVEQGLGRFEAAVDVCAVVLERLEVASVAPAWEREVRMTMANALWELGRRAEARAMASQVAESLGPDESELRAVTDIWLQEHAD